MKRLGRKFPGNAEETLAADNQMHFLKQSQFSRVLNVSLIEKYQQHTHLT